MNDEIITFFRFKKISFLDTVKSITTCSKAKKYYCFLKASVERNRVKFTRKNIKKRLKLYKEIIISVESLSHA